MGKVSAQGSLRRLRDSSRGHTAPKAAMGMGPELASGSGWKGICTLRLSLGGQVPTRQQVTGVITAEREPWG